MVIFTSQKVLINQGVARALSQPNKKSLYINSLRARKAWAVYRGGGNETHSHLERPRSPTRTTLGFFKTPLKKFLDF